MHFDWLMPKKIKQHKPRKRGKPWIRRKCEQCGKWFETQQSMIDKEFGSFCSEKCYHRHLDEDDEFCDFDNDERAQKCTRKNLTPAQRDRVFRFWGYRCVLCCKEQRAGVKLQAHHVRGDP